MAAIPKFDEPNLQALSDILGDTSTGLTGSEIGRFLRFLAVCMEGRRTIYDKVLLAKCREPGRSSSAMATSVARIDLRTPFSQFETAELDISPATSSGSKGTQAEPILRYRQPMKKALSMCPEAAASRRTQAFSPQVL